MLWTHFSKLLEEIPELSARKISRDEFVYCFYFSSCRTFYYHLPSIFASPALDMMNHDDEENHFCRTIINVALENASDEECAKLKYEKKCRSGDLTTLFPEIKEKPQPSLTPALKFFRAAGGVVQDPSRVSLSEEKQLANDKGLELLKSMPRLQVWNLPNWTGLREEVCPEPQDIIEDEGEFEDQLVQFREILQNPEGFKQTPKSQVDFIPKRAGAQFYNPNDLNPENYPWFSHEDTNNFAVMYSITGKVVSAGQQPFLHYGRNTNRFLLKTYGFTLRKNIYDSLAFYLLPQELGASLSKTDLIYDSYIRPETGLSPEGISQEQAGVEYRSKMHQLNVELFIEVKRRVSSQSASHGEQQTKNNKEHLALESAALVKYREIFEQYLSSHLRRKPEYLQLLEKHREDYKATSILYCELGQLEIAERQIRFASICMKIVDGCGELPSITEESFKQTYMNVCHSIDRSEGSHITQDLTAISSYLHLLFSNIGL